MDGNDDENAREVLGAAYQLSAGPDTTYFSVAELATQSGLAEEEAWQAMTPLLRDRLLERETDDYYSLPDAGRATYERQVQQDRVVLLQTLYELSGGNHLASLHRDGVRQRTGLPEQAFRAALNYLVSRRWCSIPTGLARITPEGVQAYERMRQPSSPSVPSVSHVTHNNINVHNSTVGAVQAGASSVANVTQQSGVSGGELAELFSELRGAVAQLPEADRAEAKELVEALEEQAKSPKKGVLKSLVDGLKATASLAGPAVKIYEHIAPLLSK